MCCQHEDTGQCQQDTDDFIEKRFSFHADTGAEQYHDRGKILQNSRHCSSRELNGQKIKELADTDAQQTIDDQFSCILFASPWLKNQFVTIAPQAPEEQNDTGQSQSERYKPPAVHAFYSKKILPH